MMRGRAAFLTALATLALAAGCGDRAILRPVQSTGAHPQLPKPFSPVVPTVNIASAEGWPAGAMPVAAEGLRVTPFADNLAHPRAGRTASSITHVTSMPGSRLLGSWPT